MISTHTRSMPGQLSAWSLFGTFTIATTFASFWRGGLLALVFPYDYMVIGACLAIVVVFLYYWGAQHLHRMRLDKEIPLVERLPSYLSPENDAPLGAELTKGYIHPPRVDDEHLKKIAELLNGSGFKPENRNTFIARFISDLGMKKQLRPDHPVELGYSLDVFAGEPLAKQTELEKGKELLLLLGMCGTVLGFSLALIMSSGSEIDEWKQAIFDNVGIAALTTLTGMVCTIILIPALNGTEKAVTEIQLTLARVTDTFILPVLNNPEHYPRIAELAGWQRNVDVPQPVGDATDAKFISDR